MDLVARLDRVGFDYREFAAVEDLSLEIGSGITGLLGLNGVGKSTVLRMLATATVPSRGRLEILGVNPQGGDVRKLRRHLGYLPQDPYWSPGLRVREFLELFSWMRHLDRDEGRRRARVALARANLEHLADRRLGSLSGGEHRRAMLAQALLAEPGLLILDEPTAGLDPRQRVEMREMLVEVAKTTAVVLSTHLLEDVSTIASRLLILDAGQLVFEGTPAELAVGSHEAPTATDLEEGFLRLVTRKRHA